MSIFFIFFNTYFKKEVNTKISIKQINLKKNQSNEIRANLIQKFKYTSSNNEGNSYTISSETGELPEKQSELVLMEGVEAIINIKNSTPIKILSNNAIFNKVTYDTKFYEKVLIIYEDHTISAQNLDLFFKKNIASISNNIIYKNLNTLLQADMVEIDLLTKKTKIFMNNNKEKIKILTLN